MSDENLFTLMKQADYYCSKCNLANSACGKCVNCRIRVELYNRANPSAPDINRPVDLSAPKQYYGASSDNDWSAE